MRRNPFIATHRRLSSNPLRCTTGAMKRTGGATIEGTTVIITGMGTTMVITTGGMAITIAGTAAAIADLRQRRAPQRAGSRRNSLPSGASVSR